ncbi:MAG: amidase, partial [Acidimicrobiales bacterium]
MTTFIVRFETSGSGVRLAVKDLIDMAGVPTTAGCRAVADRAEPAPVDAACLAGARTAGARIVGRANLHELALGVTGENPWFGTPVNPLDPGLVPGGSSSGCAVAVANDDADVAFGSDTGGSVRIPAACCGTSGLKTTFGRIPLEGVWPLSPSFDTIGPMARDNAGIVLGMQLLEPGFTPAPRRALRVGRIRPEADPRIDDAVDRALREAEFDIVEIAVPEWDAVTAAAGLLLVVEAYETNRALLESHPEGVGHDVTTRLLLGRGVDDSVVASGRDALMRWQSRLDGLFSQVDLLATPTLTVFPPPLGQGEE